MRDCEAFMRFRLTYNGPLKAAKHPSTVGPEALYTDKRAEHKHHIRRQFHEQLKYLWQRNPFLRDTRLGREYNPRGSGVLPASAYGIEWAKIPNEGTAEQKQMGPRMVDILAECYRHSRYRFVPLVRQEISLTCSLRVLFLRRDFPAPVLSAGDIDNRLKTLIDALRMPHPNEGVPISPSAGEDPFLFFLMMIVRSITWKLKPILHWQQAMMKMM